jgi:DNA-binding CsgD family transcriptional regulator
MMNLSLNPYMEVSQARNEAAMVAGLERFANALGFGLFNAVKIQKRPGHPSSVVSWDNYPLAFLHMAHDPVAGARDTVVALTKRLAVPFSYDQQTYVDDGAADLWEEQAPFGYHTGIAVALHMPGNKVFTLGFDREAPLPRSARQMNALYASLMLMAVHANEGFQRIASPALHSFATPPQPSLEPLSLTPRENQVLQRAIGGKTSAQIADALRVSERTVNFHAGNAMAKLGCASRMQACLKAVRLGLISC